MLIKIMIGVLIAVFGILIAIGLIMIIAGIILSETKYNNMTNPWPVQVLIWGGLVIFILSVILVAISAAKSVMDKKKKKGYVACSEGGCDDDVEYLKRNVKTTKSVRIERYKPEIYAPEISEKYPSIGENYVPDLPIDRTSYYN